MKYLKILTGLLLAVVMFITPVFAATLNEPVISDTQRLSLSGNIPGSAGARVTVQILYPGVDEDDVRNVTKENFESVFSNVFQVLADNSGNFTVPEYTLNDISGKYSVRVMWSTVGSSPVLFEDAFTYVSPQFETLLIDTKLTASKDEAESFAQANAEILLGESAVDFSNLSPDLQAKAISLAVGEREKLSNGKFSSVEQFSSTFKRAVMMASMLSAGNTDAADSILISGITKYKLEDVCSPILLYKNTLSAENRKQVLADVLSDNQNNYLSDYFKALGDKSLLDAVANVSNYSQIEEILTANELWLGIDLDAYKVITDKRVINETIATAGSNSISELVTVIQSAVSIFGSGGNVTQGQNGGGRPGGGGGGAAVSGNNNVSADFSNLEETKEEAKLFSDLSGFAWAEEAIYALRDAGIVSGVSDTSFAPERNITREEFVKILYTALYGDDLNYISYFEDVNKSDWFYPYISAANAKGLVNGISEKTFGTGKNITRQDMAVMAYRFAKEKGILKTGGTSQQFADNNLISDYALEAVDVMSSMGIINGVGNNLFNPTSYSNRAQAAKIVHALLRLNAGGGF